MSERDTYRNELSVAQGTPRRVYGAKAQAKRAAHTLVVQHTENVATTIPAGQQHWARDLRRGRMSIYGGLLRFIDILYRRGVSIETALMIPGWIEHYIREVWHQSPPSSPAIPLHLVTTGEYERAA